MCEYLCGTDRKKNLSYSEGCGTDYDEEKVSLVKNMGIDAICPSELSEKELANYIEIEGGTYVE